MIDIPIEKQCKCANCSKVFDGSELCLAETPDLGERLDPGGTVPAGECPDCGALAYLVQNPAQRETASLMRRVAAVLEGLGVHKNDVGEAIEDLLAAADDIYPEH